MNKINNLIIIDIKLIFSPTPPIYELSNMNIIENKINILPAYRPSLGVKIPPIILSGSIFPYGILKLRMASPI